MDSSSKVFIGLDKFKFQNMFSKASLVFMCSLLFFFFSKGLNMYRGEIFADPMFLQKDLQSAKFLAMDVTCRYVPYINKVSEALTHLKPLQEMRHCLSVMHAKAHNTKCEVKLLSN
jgi:hypothetical protein